MLSRDVLHQPITRAQFFAVPDPVTVQDVLFPLRSAYTASREVPVHNEHFPVAPFSRWFVNDVRVEYFVREAAAAGVDVLEVPVSFDEPDISSAVTAYQRMLGVDGVRADESELIERSQGIFSSFGGSLEHHLSEDFFAVSAYLRESAKQHNPPRKWEARLLARYVTDQRIPDSVLREGLSEAGLSLSDEVFERVESQRVAYESSEFALSHGVVSTVLFDVLRDQFYGPL